VDIATLVRTAREARGWSQTDLAERSGVSHSGISALEKGKGAPTMTTLRKLANALGVPVAQLIGSEPVRGTLAQRLADWLEIAPKEKADLVYQVAKAAGFGSAMTRAAS
jgi:transcriptional regulator with XRE-family HTH domain